MMTLPLPLLLFGGDGNDDCCGGAHAYKRPFDDDEEDDGDDGDYDDVDVEDDVADDDVVAVAVVGAGSGSCRL